MITQLKADKAKLLAQVEGIQAELDADDCDLNAEQRSAREARADKILADAKGIDGQIKEIEAREHKARERAESLSALRQNEAPTRKTRATAATDGVVVGEPAWVKDPMKGFKSPAEFINAVLSNRPATASDERLRYLAVAGTDENQVGSDPYGGFLVPTGMSPNLLQITPEDDPFAGRTTAIPMSSPTVEIPARVDKNHTSSVSGGFTVSRKVETAQATDSRGEFEKITLKATSVFGLSYATEDLLTDSPISFAAIVQSGFQQEFQSNHIKEMLRGTGVGEPEGILNSPALVSQAVEGGQANGTIVGENVLKMRSRCWRFQNSIWIANHDAYPQLAKLHISGSESDVFFYQPARGEDVPDTMLGRPVFYSEYASTLGQVGDLMLVNASQILEGTLQPMQGDESVHVRFDRHERTFKFWMRNDARGWWRSALTPNKSSSTLSPFVTLAIRA